VKRIETRGKRTRLKLYDKLRVPAVRNKQKWRHGPFSDSGQGVESELLDEFGESKKFGARHVRRCLLISK
jgi:hypothetical protein